MTVNDPAPPLVLGARQGTPNAVTILLDEGDPELEQHLEGIDADPLVRLVIALAAVRQVQAREALDAERVRVRATARDDRSRLVAARAQRPLGELDLRRPGRDPVGT